MMMNKFFKALGIFVWVLMSVAPRVQADPPKLDISQIHEPFEPGKQRKGWDFSELALIPLYQEGRLMPFDSFAGDAVLAVTGHMSYQGWNSVELVLSWMVAANYWQNQAMIHIGHKDLKRQLLLDEEKLKFTPAELLSNEVLIQYAEGLSGRSHNQVGMRTQTKMDPREQQLKGTVTALEWFKGLVSGEAWRVIPTADDQWKTLYDTKDLAPDELEIKRRFGEMIKAYYLGKQEPFEQAALAARKAVEAKVNHWDEAAQKRVSLEHTYNLAHPFQFAWGLYLLGALVTLLRFLTAKPKIRKNVFRLGLAIICAGILFHSFGFFSRIYITQRPPVSNMYESIVWVMYGVLAFAFILFWRTRQEILVTVAATVSAFGLIMADAAPVAINPTMRNLEPVLRSNYWLIIHVMTITLSYAAFALTAGIGNVALWKYFRKSKKEMENLNQLGYRAMQIGVVLLAAGTILGGVWADESWGKFWSWDPKEVWALIALLCYLAVLHARFAGWAGQFGFAAFTVVCFMSVVMSWYGVNFILGVGLHSYGFAVGGTNIILGLCGLQLAYVLFISAHRLKWV